MAHHNRLPPLVSDWENWIFSNLESKAWNINPKLPWCLFFSFAPWEIWLLRNTMIVNKNIEQEKWGLEIWQGNLGRAGLGEIIRDYSGDQEKACCQHIVKASNIEAKLWALRNGLKLAIDFSISLLKLMLIQL
ncbi:hypothetical protein PVK06_027303 [Gossypium arboreum]|uniref:RNase H type-1 domain-containing protein n=1 Tax=Gossypium arboreum TaxID=29729 RepID=A0ABR0P2G8_GOSAR|nr:hypothetical protein PVK06_027303 [Gossypium arboreum]